MKLHQIFKGILLISALNSLKLANLRYKWLTTISQAAELKISRILQSASAFHRVAADCFDCSGRRAACKSTSRSRHGCLYSSVIASTGSFTTNSLAV